MTRAKLFIKHLLGRDLWLAPEIQVSTTFLGSNYGGWGLDLSHLTARSIIYSFGIGEDASFDLALIAALKCTVHGFDPTPKSLAWVEQNIRDPKFLIHPWALGGSNGELELWLPVNPNHVSATLSPGESTGRQSFKAPCFMLEGVMDQLGHDRVDVLKMDIEGAEYGVIERICEDRSIERVGQVLIEFHHWMRPFKRKHTRDALTLLRTEGYQIGWVSESGHEILLVR